MSSTSLFSKVCTLSLSFIHYYNYLSIRFHDANKEPVIGCEIVPVLDDNVQLTVEEYRQQLYRVCSCY